MTIQFNQIPILFNVPGQHVEIDNSRANRGLAGMPSRVLMFGTPNISTAANSALDVPRLVNSADEVAAFAGQGSMLHGMACVFFANNITSELSVLPVSNASGTKAAATVTIAGTPTATGTLAVYIGGVRVAVTVTSSDTATTIAAAIVAAVGDNLDLPVTAANAAGVVTLTAKFVGAAANDIGLQLNYYADDASPAGLTVTTAAFTGGAATISLANALAAVSSEWYTDVIFPFNDLAVLTEIKTEAELRWGPMNQQDWMVYAARRDSATGNISWLTANHNAAHLTVLGIEGSRTISGNTYQGSPSPSYAWAAAYGSFAAFSRSTDPAVTIGEVAMQGVYAAPVQSRYNWTERNNLIGNGVATYKTTAGNTPTMEYARTTYRLNGSNLPDASYMDVEDVNTLSYLRFTIRVRFSEFLRWKLAQDGTRFGAGQNVMTPTKAKSILIQLFSDWEDAGLVEDRQQFVNEVFCEVSSTDRNRLNAHIPPNLINRFRRFAAQLQFIR